MSKIRMLDDVEFKKNQTLCFQKAYPMFHKLSDDFINVKMKRHDVEFKCCDKNVTRYIFEIKNQQINKKYISLLFDICVCNKQIHCITLEEMSLNIGRVIIDRGTEDYQSVSLLNIFMEKEYNKKNYIDHVNCSEYSYKTIYDKNLIICYEGDAFNGIEVNNKKLFKNVIVIMKCIVDNIKKKLCL